MLRISNITNFGRNFDGGRLNAGIILGGTLPRALITVNSLVERRGSEVSTLELAKSLLQHGWSVDVYTNLLGQPLQADIDELKATSSFRVNTDPYEYMDPNYDLIWIQHSLLPDSVIDHLVEVGQNCAIIWHHMSFFAHIELPFNSALENKLSDFHSFVSGETRAELLEYGLTRQNFVFPNPAPFEFQKDIGEISSDLQRIAVVSNHPPQELIDLAKSNVDNFQIQFFGETSESRRVTPEFLSSFDAVISIGKTVQYALCLNRPVFIYDHFGGSGWVNSDRYESQMFHNFSGRDYPVRKNSDEIRDALLSGFEDSRKFVKENIAEFREKFDLDKTLEIILAKPEIQAPTHKRLQRHEGLQFKALNEQLRGLFRTLRFKESLLAEANRESVIVSMPGRPSESVTAISTLLIVLITRSTSANEINRAKLSARNQSQPFNCVAIVRHGIFDFELEPHEWALDSGLTHVVEYVSGESFNELATCLNSILKTHKESFVAFNDGSTVQHSDFLSTATQVLSSEGGLFVNFPRNRVIEEFSYGEWLEIGFEHPRENVELSIPHSPFKAWRSLLAGLTSSLFQRNLLAENFELDGEYDFALFYDFMFRLTRNLQPLQKNVPQEIPALVTEFEISNAYSSRTQQSEEIQSMLRQLAFKSLDRSESLRLDMLEQNFSHLANLISQVAPNVVSQLQPNTGGLEARILNYIKRIPSRISKFRIRRSE